MVDPYTVRITTPTPDAAFLERLFEVPILPPAYLKQVGEQGFLQKPVGSGPYRWVEWVKGSHFTLEANPKYWRGEPAVKRATFKLIPEIATRISALKAGECDIALQVPPDLIEDVEKTGTVRIAPAESPRIIYFILYPQSALGGGTPLNDVRVRQAINHAVDVDKIIKFILNGQAVRVATLYGRQTAGFDPEVKPYEYNPQRAEGAPGPGRASRTASPSASTPPSAATRSSRSRSRRRWPPTSRRSGSRRRCARWTPRPTRR